MLVKIKNYNMEQVFIEWEGLPLVDRLLDKLKCIQLPD